MVARLQAALPAQVDGRDDAADAGQHDDAAEDAQHRRQVGDAGTRFCGQTDIFVNKKMQRKTAEKHPKKKEKENKNRIARDNIKRDK